MTDDEMIETAGDAYARDLLDFLQDRRQDTRMAAETLRDLASATRDPRLHSIADRLDREATATARIASRSEGAVGEVPISVLRDLACVDSDHPDFNPEWREAVLQSDRA